MTKLNPRNICQWICAITNMNKTVKPHYVYWEQGQKIDLAPKQTNSADGGTQPQASLLGRPKLEVSRLLTQKNVHFLLGAGASGDAIPAMKELQDGFKEHLGEKASLIRNIYNRLCSKNDLEDILGKLYSAIHADEVFLEGKGEDVSDRKKLIEYIKKYLREKTNPDRNKEKTKETIETYKKFYQRVALRNRDLARINIFTTNYDLLNEYALDELEINYNNGFGGGLDRRFNPARFHYTLSRKLDPSIEKFEPIEDMVYLHKLHGSINWRRQEASPPEIPEIVEEKTVSNDTSAEEMLIYPSPLKEGDTLASPYSDLMREFKSKLLLPNSALFVIGYSFSDDHINRTIYQAMAMNTSLSIFIFGEGAGKLKDSKDPRHYQLFEENGGNNPVHHFQRVVDEILPKEKKHEDKELLDRLRNLLAPSRST